MGVFNERLKEIYYMIFFTNVKIANSGDWLVLEAKKCRNDQKNNRVVPKSKAHSD